MIGRFFSRQTVVQGQAVKEPTPLAIVLTALGILGLLGVSVFALFSLNPLGHDWIVGSLLAILLAWLLVKRRPAPALDPPTSCRTWFRRVQGVGRTALRAVPACWLGLLVWLHVSPGGAAPPPKHDPAAIRIVTWNIHCGQEDGPVWERFNWAGRKHALETAVRDAGPDILCVQEARPGQVAFLEKVLPQHQRVGVGRDDGQAAGEHCAIWFDPARFELLHSDTFWLEEPTDRPAKVSRLDPRRICTWLRLRDRSTGRTLCVYNTHLYLTEEARQSAARIILDRMAKADPNDAVIFTGDFNTTPTAPAMRLFSGAGLVTSAEAAGKPAGTPTYHFYGIPLRCIDAIFVNSSWRVQHSLVLNAKPGGTLPSDHFGVLADLTFRE